MKTVAKAVALLVVLALSVPSYGEILVYKYTITRTNFEQTNGEWAMERRTYKGYKALDINYDDYTVSGGAQIRYWIDNNQKVYERHPFDVELVRVPVGTNVQWVIVAKDAESDGEKLTRLSLEIMSGQARHRGIGGVAAREVASKLAGHCLRDELGAKDADRDVEVASKLSLTLHSAWTYWANGDGANEGNQDLTQTMQMITDWLEAKGYGPQQE